MRTSCAVAADLTALVAGGEPSLERLVLNLVSNACEGRDRRRATEVVVRAVREPPPSGIRLEVEDDGPGFTPAQLACPLRPAVDKPGGLGIGLGVVRGLVEASGGQLRLSNRPNGGAMVCVTLVC